MVSLLVRTGLAEEAEKPSAPPAAPTEPTAGAAPNPAPPTAVAAEKVAAEKVAAEKKADEKKAEAAASAASGPGRMAAEPAGARRVDAEVPLASEIDHPIPVGYTPGYRRYPALGLHPLAPRGELTLPGGATPSYAAPVIDQDWTFKFTGYLESALAVGFGSRNNDDPERPAAVGQKQRTLHTRPYVPDRYGSFEKTIVVPGPWVQLNFNYGTPVVQGTVILAAFNQGRGASYGYLSSQLGIDYAYLTYTPEPFGAVRVRALVGAYADRYGQMSRWSEGKYGVSLIGAIYGAGETVTAEVDLSSDMTLTLEQGFKADLDKVPVGLFPDPSNGYADQDLGSSLTAHAHVGLSYKSFQFAGHAIHTWEQDDRFTATPTAGEIFPADVDGDGYLAPSQRPNGRLDIFGFDVRYIDDPMHHLYAGMAYVDADGSASLSGLTTVLNASGGEMLREEWFGKESGGTGSALILGVGYDVSLFKLFKDSYRPIDTDLTLSLFGIYNKISSAETTWVPGGVASPDQMVRFGDRRIYDGLERLKFGTEVTFNWLSWLGFSLRADRIMADLKGAPGWGSGFSAADRSHSVLSPRVLLFSDFYSREQVVLSYSHWFYGKDVLFYPNGPNPPQGLDTDVVAIMGSMYW